MSQAKRVRRATVLVHLPLDLGVAGQITRLISLRWPSAVLTDAPAAMRGEVMAFELDPDEAPDDALAELLEHR